MREEGGIGAGGANHNGWREFRHNYTMHTTLHYEILVYLWAISGMVLSRRQGCDFLLTSDWKSKVDVLLVFQIKSTVFFTCFLLFHQQLQVLHVFHYFRERWWLSFALPGRGASSSGTRLLLDHGNIPNGSSGQSRCQVRGELGRPKARGRICFGHDWNGRGLMFD